MRVEALLRLLVENLHEVGIRYMVTGSLASSYHGTPRSTRDIDVVFDADDVLLRKLAQRLRDAGLYVSDTAIIEAVEARGFFNAVDGASGWKIDFILLKDRPFSQQEFRERESADYVGLSLSLVRAEDIVVAKLEWAQLGESERQLRDVAGILAVQGDRLDRHRVEHWVAELGLEEQWEEALRVERDPMSI